jgi:hypothetical protein
MGDGRRPAFPAPSTFEGEAKPAAPGAIAQRERALLSLRCLKTKSDLNAFRQAIC